MSITVVQVKANTNQTTSISVGSGQGWSTPTSGNLLVAFASKTSWSFSNGTISMSGWTELYQTDVNRVYGVFYKESDGTESTITASSSGSYQFGLVVYEISGHDTTTPIADHANGAYSSSSSSITLPSTTPDGDNALFLAFADFEDDDCSAFTYTNSFTVGAYAESSTGLPDNAVGSGYKIVTDGSSQGTTVGKVGGGSDEWWGYIVCVNEAGPEPGVVLATTDELTLTTYKATVEPNAIEPNVVQTGQAVTSNGQSVSVGSGEGWSTPTSGNLIVILGMSWSQGSGSSVLPINWVLPSGFTEVCRAEGNNTTDYDQGIILAYKVSNGTESSLTLSYTDTVQSGSDLTVILYELEDVDPDDPIDGYDTDVSTGSTNVYNLSVTVTNDKSLCIAGHSTDVYAGTVDTYSDSFIDGPRTIGREWASTAYKEYISAGTQGVDITVGTSIYSGAALLVAFNPEQPPSDTTNPPIIIMLGF